MATVVILMGNTGTGKSRAISTLNPEETFIVNVCKKPLPFKGSRAKYSLEKKNFLEADEKTGVKDNDGNITLSADVVLQVLNRVNEAYPHVKTIVIDDAMYLLKYKYIDLSRSGGFQKFVDFTIDFKRLLLKCQNLRDDIIVYLNLHPARVESDGRTITYEASVPGKMINTTINPLENTTIVLFSEPKFDINGKPEYGFYTQSTMLDGIIIPAKSPEGMFDSEFIPNDLAAINESINNYLQNENDND